jgi:hypothetical protein
VTGWEVGTGGVPPLSWKTTVCPLAGGEIGAALTLRKVRAWPGTPRAR